MVLFRRILGPACISTLIMSCAVGSSLRQAPSDNPYAVIGTSEARFVFPRDSSGVYTWNVPRPNAYSGDGEFIWEVTWRPPPENLGKTPDELSLISRWRPGAPKRGSLSELVSTIRPEKATVCLSCDLASAVEGDPGLVASVEDGCVVLRVRGADAVRRIFPVAPDSVTFRRRVGGPTEPRSVHVTRSND
jgi:hypothetical protein